MNLEWAVKKGGDKNDFQLVKAGSFADVKRGKWAMIKTFTILTIYVVIA